MQLSDVVIGLEATSIYGDSLVYALREDGRLGKFQRKIHVLNPKQVRKFKEAYPDLPKNDWVDAFVIADHLRFGRIAREVYMDDYRYKALQTLTRARFEVIQNLTRENSGLPTTCFSNAPAWPKIRILLIPAPPRLRSWSALKQWMIWQTLIWKN